MKSAGSKYAYLVPNEFFGLDAPLSATPADEVNEESDSLSWAMSKFSA
jgi:hypothetical protein